VLQELKAEIKELKTRVHRPLKRMETDHSEMPLTTAAVDVQSKNGPGKDKVIAEAMPSATELPPKSRIRYRTSQLNSNGTRTEKDGTPPNPRNVTDSDTDIAFEAKEMCDKNGKITSHEVTLKSKGLRSLVWKIIGDWLLHEKTTSQKSWVNNDQVWTSFLFVLHYWTEFEAEANDERFKDDLPHQDLKELLLYIETVQPEVVDTRRKLETLEKIPYRFFWLLFRPGSLIVTKPDPEQNHYQVLQVHNHRFNAERGTGDEMVVHAWAFDWNGNDLVRRYFEFPLGKHPHVDETHIRDLPCWPLRYMYRDNVGESDEKNEAAMRDKLVKRGREMREHCVLKSGKNRMCNFDGVIQLWEREPVSDDTYYRIFGVQAATKRTTHRVRDSDALLSPLADVSTDQQQAHNG
jgi:hypothetical protein